MNLLERQVFVGPEAWATAFALAVIAALVGRWLVTLPALSSDASVNSLGKREPLVAYLTVSQRVEPTTPGLAAGAWSNPFDPPKFAFASPAATAQATRVTAILISQERRVAIVNDRIVSVGDALPGDARIEAIEPDQVIINRGGRREVLRLLPLAGIR